MTPEFEISSMVWNWCVQFFLSMGVVTGAALSVALGLVLIDWLYVRAKNIEALPVPPDNYWQAKWNLTRFGAIAVGVFLAPIVSGTSYYLIFLLVWKLAPAMVSAQEPEPDVIALFDNISALASVAVLTGALAVIFIIALFLFLRRQAKLIDKNPGHVGLASRFVMRYFQENVILGTFFLVIAFPVLFYFIYNIALFLLVVSSSARHDLRHIILPNADALYMHSVTTLSSLLLIVLLLPFAWLLVVRGAVLLGRYTSENAPMNLIFRRSAKFFLLSLLGFMGYMAMGYWAQLSFKYAVMLIAK